MYDVFALLTAIYQLFLALHKTTKKTHKRQQNKSKQIWTICYSVTWTNKTDHQQMIYVPWVGDVQNFITLCTSCELLTPQRRITQIQPQSLMHGITYPFLSVLLVYLLLVGQLGALIL